MTYVIRLFPYVFSIRLCSYAFFIRLFHTPCFIHLFHTPFSNAFCNTRDLLCIHKRISCVYTRDLLCMHNTLVHALGQGAQGPGTQKRRGPGPGTGPAIILCVHNKRINVIYLIHQLSQSIICYCCIAYSIAYWSIFRRTITFFRTHFAHKNVIQMIWSYY